MSSLTQTQTVQRNSRKSRCQSRILLKGKFISSTSQPNNSSHLKQHKYSSLKDVLSRDQYLAGRRRSTEPEYLVDRRRSYEPGFTPRRSPTPNYRRMSFCRWLWSHTFDCCFQFVNEIIVNKIFSRN
ncbi:hypothetical protein ACFE04_028702 [Oxalis oulophora]